MTENEIARIVVDTAYHIHRKLGPGLLESVYKIILVHKLTALGLNVERQKSIPIIFEGIKFDEGFRADVIVEDRVILELKSVEEVSKASKKQVLTYLRLTDKRLGLLVNFGAAYIKDGIFRIVNGLEE